MTRFRVAALATVAILAILLLLVDLHTAHTSASVDSSQSVMTAQNSPASVPAKLTVYFSGDRSLAGTVRNQLAAAIKARELQLDELLFVDDIPQDTSQNPFLAIRVDQDRALWTPFYATRHLTATLVFVQGRALDRDTLASPGEEGASVVIDDRPCVGACSEGRRSVQLDASILGLVSLPHARVQAAGKLAEEAVTLLTAGLPAHMVPERWFKRATDLAKEARGDATHSWFSMFERVAGCRGGVLMTGTTDPDSEWALMYYDASRDALTETISRPDVEARLPGTHVIAHGFGASSDGRALHVAGYQITLPPGGCGFAGWQVRSH